VSERLPPSGSALRVKLLSSAEEMGMTKKEEFELAVQLAAHERLLAELLILVRAQRGSSTRLSGFRERIAKELEQDEDHPVEIDPKEQAIHATPLSGC
jgi:hypothetical protein